MKAPQIMKAPQTGRTPAMMLGFGALILALSLGIRHGFGLFMQPISMANGWGREVFALAIAVQNLVWGAGQPFAGRLADRFGAGYILLAGAVLYAGGLLVMAYATSPLLLLLGAGGLVGVGLSGTTFSIVFGAVSRAVAPAKRIGAMGIVSAVGSLGQFVILPVTLWLIGELGWSAALLALSGLAFTMAPVSAMLAERPGAAHTEPALTGKQALVEAFGERGFWLLCFGFFVCGFQVVFIGTHLPAFLLDRGLSLENGTTVLALIGLFNVVGSYLAGRWGNLMRKPLLLAGIYISRALVIALFLIAPLSPWSAYAFGVAMGLLWLSTVPLTNGTVAAVFGARNLSMLGGVVFLFHQVGAFLGGWLGGVAYDRLGSYDLVWLGAIGLSLAAALINLPIKEAPVPRLAAALRHT
jgi:MFS family permease